MRFFVLEEVGVALHSLFSPNLHDGLLANDRIEHSYQFWEISNRRSLDTSIIPKSFFVPTLPSLFFTIICFLPRYPSRLFDKLPTSRLHRHVPRFGAIPLSLVVTGKPFNILLRKICRI